MVVGVVVNKPSTPTQIAPAAPTGVAPQQPGMVVPVPTTLAPQQQPLLNPQQMAAPQQQSAAAVAVSSLVAPPGQDLPGGEQLQQQPQVVPPFLANTKEKTPMCLINELARYNKVRTSLYSKKSPLVFFLPTSPIFFGLVQETNNFGGLKLTLFYLPGNRICPPPPPPHPTNRIN